MRAVLSRVAQLDQHLNNQVWLSGLGQGGRRLRASCSGCAEKATECAASSIEQMWLCGLCIASKMSRACLDVYDQALMAGLCPGPSGLAKE